MYNKTSGRVTVQIFAIQFVSPGFSRNILFIITVRYSFYLERLLTLPVLGSMHESWGHFYFSSHSTYQKILALLQYLFHFRVLLVVSEIRFCSAPSLPGCCQTCVERFKNIMQENQAFWQVLIVLIDRSGFRLRPHTIAFRTCSSFDAIFDLIHSSVCGIIHTLMKYFQRYTCGGFDRHRKPCHCWMLIIDDDYYRKGLIYTISHTRTEHHTQLTHSLCALAFVHE